MTRGKKLAALLAVLTLLLALTGVILQMTPQAEGETETVPLLSVEGEQVSALSWTYEGETIALDRDSEGVWSDETDPDFPLDQSQPEAMVAALEEAQALKTIEDPQALADYGLQEPLCTLEVTAGETYAIALGAETSLGGQRYLSLGDGKVYLVESALLDSLALDRYDLVQKETIPAMSDVTGLTIQRPGEEELRIVYKEDSGLAYSDLYTWFSQEDGAYTALDSDLTSTLLYAVTDLSWGDCVAYDAAEGDLAAFGLDTPGATVTVDYTQTIQVDTGETDEDGSAVYETQETPADFVLELGSYDGEDCFARIAGSTLVYRISGTTADQLLGAQAEDLLPQDVLLLDWEAVTGLDIRLDGTTYSLTKESRETTGEDGETTETYVYKMDDQEADISAYLEAIQEMEPTGSAPGAAAGDEELALTIHRSDGEDVSLAFYQYDSTTSLTSLNGERRLLVDRTQLQEILSALREQLVPA